MAHVAVRNLVKQYGALEVVHGVDFEISDGEFVVLVGPSGCGKIDDPADDRRARAGHRRRDRGRTTGWSTTTPPRDRDIAMVFQDYALYPHMTVRQNLGFGLKMRGTPRARDRRRRRQDRRDPADRGTCSTASRRSSPAASASASRSAARSPASRRCSCSTSRSPTSTPSSASRCARRSSGCTSPSTAPASTSPTTRPRR